MIHCPYRDRANAAEIFQDIANQAEPLIVPKPKYTTAKECLQDLSDKLNKNFTIPRLDVEFSRSEIVRRICRILEDDSWTRS